ncbi:MAG: TRAP transporter small permease subunit [Elusimicrobia bacterium]|nr:TRAP transporter small permease subunit [Elusimicrobiota bacterium]
MERLRKAESVILGLESALLVAILVFLIFMSFLQVILRQVFGGGILWGDTLLRHLVLWVGFLGAARASAEEKHFAFETLSDRLPPRAHAAMTAAAHLFAAAVALLLAKASWSYLLAEKAEARSLFTVGSLSVPAWLLETIIPVGFLLVFGHTALRAVLRAPEALGRTAPRP